MGTVIFRAAGAKAPRAPSRQAATLVVVAGALLLVLAAGALARLPWEAMRASFDARNWPLAPATIRSVALSERNYLSGENAADGSVWELVLDVAYVYQVDGVAYESRRASFADRAEPHDRRLRTLYSRLNFALLTGRPVEAAYDPDNPSVAVLETGFEWRGIALDVGLGIGGGLLGFWLLLSPLRRVRYPH